MAGKSKKAKKEKLADFSKAKLKLGKGKKPAANATDTSFKAKSVALPTQSITAQKDESQPTTRRNLTLNELLVQARHYSAGVRKESIFGLRELLGAHPELLEPHLSTLIPATARLISDEDSGVRKALLSLYTQILPLLPQPTLIPHASQILLHTTSALSHIFPEIRVDAIAHLDLLVEHAPKAIIKNQQRIQDAYLSMLNLRGKVGEASIQATSSLNLSKPAKTTIFKSLYRFLTLVLADDTEGPVDEEVPTSIPTWFFQTSFVTEDAYESFLRTLPTGKPGYTVIWQPEVDEMAEEDGREANAAAWQYTNDAMDEDQPGWRLADLDADEEDESPSANLTRLHTITDLCKVLHPVLLATFLDVAPDVLMPRTTATQVGGTEGDAELVWVIGRLTALVYGAALRGKDLPIDTRRIAEENARGILSKMAPYFPFGSGTHVKRDVKSEQLLHQLNVSYCELTSLLSLLGGKGKGKEIEAADGSERVAEWVVEASTAENMVAGQRLNAASYAALLPTTWSLLSSNDVLRGTIWNAILTHSKKTSRTSAVKALSVEFVARLVLLQSERGYQGSFEISALEAEEWVLSLPRLLWELNGEDERCSEIILRALLAMVQRNVVTNEGTEALGVQMIPFFSVVHPKQGKIPGPWSRLPHRVQVIGVDVVESLGMSGTMSSTRLSEAMRDETVGWLRCC